MKSTGPVQPRENVAEVGYAAAVVDRETLVRTKSIIGANRPGFVILPKERGLEIDSCYEFETGQWAYVRSNGPPPAGGGGGGWGDTKEELYCRLNVPIATFDE